MANVVIIDAGYYSLNNIKTSILPSVKKT